jgi:hypothetical protein
MRAPISACTPLSCTFTGAFRVFRKNWNVLSNAIGGYTQQAFVKLVVKAGLGLLAFWRATLLETAHPLQGASCLGLRRLGGVSLST